MGRDSNRVHEDSEGFSSRPCQGNALKRQKEIKVLVFPRGEGDRERVSSGVIGLHRFEVRFAVPALKREACTDEFR
jgi:hypothetical protein